MAAIPGAVSGSIWNAAATQPAPYGALCECWCGGSRGWRAALVLAHDARLAGRGGLLGPAARALRARVSYRLAEEGLALAASERLAGSKRLRLGAEGAGGADEEEKEEEEEEQQQQQQQQQQQRAAAAAEGEGQQHGQRSEEAMYRVRVLEGAGAAAAPAAAGGAAAAGAAAAPPADDALAPTDVLAAWGSAADTFTLAAASHLRPLQGATRALLLQRLRAADAPASGSGSGSAQQLLPREQPPPGVPRKYWDRRHALWRRFEQGIAMDAEGWYSTTPEAAALHMAGSALAAAARCGGCDTSAGSAGVLALDLFAGCGGNSVAWLRRLPRAAGFLVAVELSLPRLLAARANARVYSSDLSGAGVVWVHGDALELLAGLGAAAGAGAGQWARAQQVERLRALAGAAASEPVTVAAVLEALVGAPQCSSSTSTITSSTSSSTSSSCIVDVLFCAPPWGGGKYKAACSSGKGRFSLARDLCVSGGGGGGGGGGGRRLSGIQLLQAASAAGVAGVLQAFLPKHTGMAEVGEGLGRGSSARPDWVEVRSEWAPGGGAGAGAGRSAAADAAADAAPLEAGGSVSVESLGVDGRAIGLVVTAVAGGPSGE